MKRLTTLVALITLLAISGPVAAQNNELGFEARKERFGPGQYGERPGGSQRDRESMVQRRFEQMAEYLELTDEQTLQWKATLDDHLLGRQNTREQVDAWRQEFRQLAKAEQPDLRRLGEIALAIHREVELQSSSRDQLLIDLKKILTDEQVEKLDERLASRRAEKSGNRGQRRRGPGRSPDGG